LSYEEWIEMAKRTKSAPVDQLIEMGGIPLKPGDGIGPYRYDRPIGIGGMAYVLLARDPGDNLVALKVLKASRVKTGLTRFRREFRALARLCHPNVIGVESYGDIFGHPYIAMDYVEGTDLHKTIREFRQMPVKQRWRRVEDVLIDVGRALNYIHRRGLVHRDLKPSNILIDQSGCCRLTDFGIVKDLQGSDPHKSTTLVGTWAYSSPEQITGQSIDHRSDLYSLGVILYAMLTGRRPFTAKNMSGYLALHQTKKPRKPSVICSGVPAKLEEICLKLLQKAPHDRYQSASEMLHELEDAVVTQAPSAVMTAANWCPPIVGRQKQSDRLAKCVNQLTISQGGVAFIAGHEGLGKTELIGLVNDHAVTLGIAVYRLEFTAADGVLDGAIRLAEILRRELGNETPLVLQSALVSSSQGGQSQQLRYQLFDGIREALKVLVEDGPRVLAVDDLQWASGPVIELLGSLVRGIIGRDKLPLLLVVTTEPDVDRPQWKEFIDGESLEVSPIRLQCGPLSAKEVEELVDQIFGQSPQIHALGQRLYHETEGHPLFLSEFLRSLIQQDQAEILANGGLILVADPDGIASGAHQIPPGIVEIVNKRLENRSVEERFILSIVAAWGRPLEIDAVLMSTSGSPERILDGIDRLIEYGMLNQHRIGIETLVSLGHSKYGEIILVDMDPEQLRSVHGKLACAVEELHGHSLALAEGIGEQYRRAGQKASAWRHLARGARYLWTRSLFAEAFEIAEVLVDLEKDARAGLSPEVFNQHYREILELRGDVYLNRGEWDRSVAMWRTLIGDATDAGDHKLAIKAELNLGQALARSGDTESGIARMRKVLKRARAADDQVVVIDALHYLATIAWQDGDLDRCALLAGQGLLVANGPEFRESRAKVLLALTAVQATRGQIGAAISGLKEASVILEDLGRKRTRIPVLCNLGELLMWRGELVKALSHTEAALASSREILHLEFEETALRMRAMIHLELGEFDEAERDLLTSLLLAEEVGIPEDILTARFYLGLTHIRQGRSELAQTQLTMALATHKGSDPESYRPCVQALLAWCWCALDRTEAARTSLRELSESLGDMHRPKRSLVLLLMSDAHEALGESLEALSCAQESDRIATRDGMKLLALRARSRVYRLTPQQVSARRTARGLAEEVLMNVPKASVMTFRAQADLVDLWKSEQS